MVALTPSIQGDEFLRKKVGELANWCKSGSASIGEFSVRKMPARIEDISFVAARGKSNKDRTYFTLVLRKKYQEWSIDLGLQFYYQPWLTNEGLTRPTGVLLFVNNSETEDIIAVEYLSIDKSIDMPGHELCIFWVDRLLKRPAAKAIFAYKKLSAADLD